MYQPQVIVHIDVYLGGDSNVSMQFEGELQPADTDIGKLQRLMQKYPTIRYEDEVVGYVGNEGDGLDRVKLTFEPGSDWFSTENEFRHFAIELLLA